MSTVLTLSLPRVIKFKFVLQPHKHITFEHDDQASPQSDEDSGRNVAPTTTVHKSSFICLYRALIERDNMEKLARVNWRTGQFSDVSRSEIIDPSPLKQGQKVTISWGRSKKEYSATITCYPLQNEDETDDEAEVLQPRRAKAKRRLVSITLNDISVRLSLILTDWLVSTDWLWL